MSHDSAFSVVPYIVQTGDSVHALWFGGAWNGPNPAIKYGFGIQYSHSYDGGLNFSPQTELVSYDSASGSNGLIAVSGRYVYVLYGAIVPANPNYYRIAILRSTNAGISWEPHIFLGDYYRWAIAARDSSVYVYFGYLDSNRIKAGILVSKDYGVNWTILNDSILVSNQPAPPHRNSLWAASGCRKENIFRRPLL